MFRMLSILIPVIYQVFHSNTNNSNYRWTGTLTGTPTLGQSEPENNDHEWVLNNTQIFRPEAPLSNAG